MATLAAVGDGEASFSNLPCLGSRALLAGWYSVVDEALRASDHDKVMKLSEAALCLPLRLRCGPSLAQVSLDSINYSEDLYASNSASSVFFTFAEKCMTVFPPDFVGNNSAKSIASRAKTHDISFHGSAVGDNVARALLNVAPFVIAPDFKRHSGRSKMSAVH